MESVKDLKEKIMLLETQVKHLNNELRITKNEYDATAKNYFEIYSHMGKKVEDQAELLLTVLNNIPAHVYWKDKDLVYIGCNIRFAETFGFANPEDIVGKTDRDIFGVPEEADAFSSGDSRVIENDKPEFHNIQMQTTPKGDIIWVDSNKVPLHDSNNNVIGVLGVYEDITLRLQKEKEQKKLEDHMRQSQKLQSLGVLAGGIAHDFNNILTPIIGYAEMALDDISNQDHLKIYLERIVKGSLRAKDLVKQILTFSRHRQQKKEPLHFSSVLKEALKLIRSTLPATIEMKDRIDSNSGMILGDPTQLHQVIINLCTNAAQAMSENSGRIEIGLEKKRLERGELDRSEFTPGSYLLMTVKDNGEGMTDELMQRIFEPFFTTKEIGQGTGMGLSVVHGIVDSLNGFIKVESHRGEGSEFKIFIPEYIGKTQEHEVPDSGEQTIPLGNRQRILFIDDESLIVEMISSMLASLNYDVLAVSSPDGALNAFKEAPGSFDLVMTDLTMPGMTGISLAEEILRVRSDMPVILCSGHSNSIDLNSKEARGIVEVINKPVSKSELGGVLKKVFDNSAKSGVRE
jgi:PAS domain S-box-containing protein